MITLFAVLFAATTAVSLNGEWRLDYFPQPLSGAVRNLPLKVPFDTVQASVPGNCELDLVNAGLLPPLEMGLNVIKARKYEGHQWLYTKAFDAPDVPRDGSRAMLVFEGIDTLADVFLNGERIGETANMLIQHRFDVTGRLKKGANTVQVLMRSAFYETQEESVGQMTYHMGFADNVPFRKAAHMGGWDIFPRIYASGLWRGVSLEIEPPVRIGDVAWITRNYRKDGTRNVCGVKAQFRVQGPISAFTDGSTVRVSITHGKERVASRERPLNSVHNSFDLTAHGFDLWWPKGAGTHPLYDAVIEIVSPDGTVLARDARRIGFRTVELVRDDVYGPERQGQFLFKVNGEPIYVRGSNWVPVDAVPSRQAGRIVETLKMFDDLNCNMVRVWGGGVYEPDAFFDFCDEHGIMVWQDFMTGCSQFPQNDRYAAATEDEVRNIVLRFRNRPSLVLWSGNNENDSALWWSGGRDFGLDPNGDRPSRVTIPRVLREFDITRPYLPSSPYHSPEVAAGKAQPSEMHLWGERGYYKTPFYTNSPCWFASEMGYHGAPNRASLERMITRGCVYPWKNPATNDCLALDWNDEWRLKASNPFLDRTSGLWGRNNLMTKQAKLMFGDVERDLDGFIAESQTIQAEAMKTFCELFRSRKFTRFNGLIWWNVRDGWPQISDAVVDYYGGRKQAYYALKAAQRDVLALLVDDRSAWVVNDLMRPVKGHALYRDRVTGKVLLECDYEVAANSKTRLGEVALSGQGVVDIEYTVSEGMGVVLSEKNHFLYGEPPFRWADVRAWTHDATIWRKEAGSMSAQDVVAAAYALRTPERTDRFANGWAFVKAVFGCDLSGGASANLVVLDYDHARNPDGQDAAIRKVAQLLEPGDVVASDGTNVCLYVGDVYGDGRGKVLALDSVGGVCEWDVGTYLLNWPHNMQKLAVAKRFAVLRPLNGASGMTRPAVAGPLPQGVGEKIEDERVRAVVATAWAHYLKNECTQYDSISLVSDDVASDTYEKWSRRNYRLPIEAGTRDRTYYSVCSSFAYEVYYGAFGYGIGEDSKGYASFMLTQYPPQDILVYRHEKGTGGKTGAEVLKEARSALRPGDVIAYANVRPKKSGHVMLYIGEVDGIGTIIHSTGQKFDYQNCFDKTEHEGTIIKNDVDSTLFTKGSPRYLLKYDQFVILRPLKKDSLALTATGKARAAHPKFRYDRCVAHGIYGSVVEGESLRYSVEVFNAATEPCDATVRETLPEGTELISFSDGATANANTLVWPIVLKPGERRTVEWTVRVKVGTAGSFIVAENGSAGGIPSNRLATQVVARKVSVADAFRWADGNLTDPRHLPSCRVKGWCGGYRTTVPPRDERVRETRSRDLMPGDVVAFWKKGQTKPSGIWVRDEIGLVGRTANGMERIPEAKVSALLAADMFCAFRPAAE